MSINYEYYFRSQVDALGGITFGLWYAESQLADDTNQHLFFKSYEEAIVYGNSDEFKQVKRVIESLKIGGN